eukprot:2549965-Alexandrium_andersonii.AAC.1
MTLSSSSALRGVGWGAPRVSNKARVFACLVIAKFCGGPPRATIITLGNSSVQKGAWGFPPGRWHCQGGQGSNTC